MNRLRDSSSPYLLQHADNPVDWFPWGPEALRKARQEDKPIFLSIGYAACHWCHVMAHESFEDSETAKLMNERFVNIKVDREERPDVDALYMDAVVAMTGQGGWPMSVFLTPQGQPFFGGTYFPPERRHGMPGFKELLIGIAQAWQEDRDRLLDTGQKLADHLRTGPRIPVSERPLSADILERATARLHEQYDWTYGGWGRAPKFPQASAIEFLFRRHQRAGDKHARDMAIDALRAMASGGIYDQLGGGFHRYSVDREWLVPHFEKMLYDNALLLATYLRGWQVTREPQFLTVAEETFAFLEREMRGPAGGYASSLDADTDGEEGKYYLWTLAEVEEAIGDARTVEIVQRALGVTPSGNFEGANVLYRAQEPAPLADTFELPADDLATRLAAAQSELLARRERRPRPGLDDKVLAAWNGLLLRALAIGAQVTRGSSWLKAARSLADFLVEKMIVDGRLRRSWRQGQARFNAYLEDYGALGVGLLELYAVDGTHRWFRVARSLADGILERFRDPEGGFFDTADDHEELIARPKSLQDSPIPSGSTLATALLQRMWALTGEDRYRQPAEAAIEAMVEPMAQHPTAFAGWLAELDFALGPQLQLALVGDPASDEFQSLAATAHAHYLPNLVIAGGPADPEDGPELLEGRSLLEGRPAAYLCQGFTCRRPTAEPSELAQQLEAAA